MKRHRKTWVFLLLAVIVIQFIQPVKNISDSREHDISHVYDIPPDIHQTLTEKCYDCHSNHTNYTWYFHIQPVGWWLAANIYRGKLHLNFSEFKNYQSDKAQSQLQAIIGTMKHRTTPFHGVVLSHPYTEITEHDEKAIHDWANNLITAKD